MDALKSEIEVRQQQMSIAFFGHKDSGKSTICGQLLYSFNAYDSRSVDQDKKDAKTFGRDS